MDRRLPAILLSIILLTTSVFARPLEREMISAGTGAQTVDSNAVLDAHDFFMFVPNDGTLAHDKAGRFIFWYPGSYFPFVDTSVLASGDLAKSVLYSSGLWMSGQVSGEIRIGDATYSSRFVPGPMSEGTFLPDSPAFRTYKLYRDSLAGNPGHDYQDWPIDQGAPTDIQGRPRIRGRQLLWSVFNDADPSTRESWQNPNPLGIEVHQSVWADTGGPSLNRVFYDSIPVTGTSNYGWTVSAQVVDANALTGHDYELRTDSTTGDTPFLEVVDLTLGGSSVLTVDIPDDTGAITFDGIAVMVHRPPGRFASFEVTANASGELVQPVSAALASVGFPTPSNADPGPGQQVNGSRWAIHGVTYYAASSDVDAAVAYGSFVSQMRTAGAYDYEIRFTGDNANPGVGGGYAWNTRLRAATWVPFELWRTGQGTPDDPGDDLRLCLSFTDIGYDDTFSLESWGAGDNCTGFCEHSGHPDDDDPFTDVMWWKQPYDTTPGEAGYLAFESLILAGSFPSLSYLFNGMVLVSVDGGGSPPFVADVPEQGTVFRIVGERTFYADTFALQGVAVPEDTVHAYEDASVYVGYRLYNRSEHAIDSFMVGFWADPDVGNTDDLVGCDSADHLFYAYNDSGNDYAYGLKSPAIGFKFLQGLVTPDDSGVAQFDGKPWPGHRSVGLYAFRGLFNIGYPFPDWELDCVLKGFDFASCQDTPSRYEHSGDPVSGTGALDNSPSERQMVGSTGPVTLAPGDSQYVLIKITAAPGEDHLQSITLLRDMIAANAWEPVAGNLQLGTDTVSYLAAEQISIDVGGFDSLALSDVVSSSLAFNDQLAPDSVTYVSGHPQFGDAYRLWFDGSDILHYTGPTDSLAFFINGHTTNGRDLYALGNLTLVPAPMGDVDGDGYLDMDDLTVLIDYLFLLGPEPAWPHAADAYCDGEGRLTITDLTQLVRYLFLGAPEPGVCSNWLEP